MYRMGTWGRNHGVGLAQGRRSSVLYKRNLGDHFFLLPILHSFRSSLPTCHLHCDKMLHKWFQWGFFHSENRRNWAIWGEKQSRIWFSREGKGREILFWRLLKGETRRRRKEVFILLQRNFLNRIFCNWCNCRGFLMFQLTFFLPWTGR